jgi:hypothetical protein
MFLLNNLIIANYYSISLFLNVKVVVYGVEIPGQEGKAGMATIKINENSDFNLESLGVHLRKNLPSFARPLFIRIASQIEYTGTFKIKKNKLVEESFNLNKINDNIFYWENKTQLYQPLTINIYKNIMDGKLRF